MRSRRILVRIVAAALGAAAVVVLAVPGSGKWLLSAGLAGLASIISGALTRGADALVLRARDAVVAPTRSGPLLLSATQDRDGHIGPLPADSAERDASPGWTALESTKIKLFIESAVERSVILTQLDVRMESHGPVPRIDHINEPVTIRGGFEPRLMSPAEQRIFKVNLGADARGQALVPQPGEGVQDFPYTVSHLDPEHFTIEVTAAAQGEFTWRVGVHWLCNGQSGVAIADRAGRPFRLVRQ